MLKTFRLYECLEMGCIPIVERRPWIPYYDLLMPGHPLPAFTSWYSARGCVQSLSKDKSRLADCQNTISGWWRAYKMRLQDEVEFFNSLGLQGAFRTSLMTNWHCRTGIKHQAWRMVELLKHASYASLQERIGITAKRMAGRVLLPTRGMGN